MGDLGTAIITAMRDQGWLLISGTNTLACYPPTRDGESLKSMVVPTVLLQQGNERRLGVLLLSLIAVYGLQWPWPPEPSDGAQGGETPRLDWW
ncbi:hypothetical protein [Prauserella cavernicola]|uniref:Uncharacterized protein n=1 Tax=Prauserella cavernicola TaxID=2800127 RepID=A0A934QTJ3_9PSEU|nr:hypothetical protein [Prauserella cavernicola]MBK1785123.1 hypothetical protein [Prauserella cavernicola]